MNNNTNAEGRSRFETLLPNGKETVTTIVDSEELQLEEDALYCPLDWYSVPALYAGLRRGEVVQAAPIFEMTPRPSDPESLVSWMLDNLDKYRTLTPSMVRSIQLSMAAHLMISNPSSARDILGMAARPTNPLVMVFRGFEPNVSAATEQLGLASSAVAMLMALLVHPASFTLVREDHDPDRMTDRVVNCTIDALGFEFWHNLVTGAAPDNPDIFMSFTSSSELVAALAFMAWEPQCRYFELGPENRHAYWAIFCRKRLVFWKKMNNAKTADEIERATAQAVANTTEHVLQYILANWVSVNSEKYDFEPDSFFIDEDASQCWLISQDLI